MIEKTIPLTKEIKARFGLHGCKKRKVRVSVSPKMTCYDCFWSEGTKSDYNMVGRNGGCIPVPQPSSPFGTVKYTEVELDENKCVVETGYFCGEVKVPVIHVNDAEAWGL